MKHNGTRLVKILLFYSLIMPFSCATCMSTLGFYKACTKFSHYYFVLQSLHKALPSTTLYHTACTKHFPVLLCTTKLARSTSQYYISNRLECDKVPRLPGKTTWQPAWKPSKRRGFAASPKDTELTTRRRRDEPLEANKGPNPQTINGNPSLRIREKQDNLGWTSKIIKSPAQRHLTYN